MWHRLALNILRYRVTYLTVLFSLTVFFAWQGSKVELSYEFVRPLPKTDSTLIEYNNFKKLFGEDGNVLMIGFEKDNLFELELFRDWYKLDREIKKIEGIKDVLSIGTVYTLERDDSLKKFRFINIVQKIPETQEELDSIKKIIEKLPFYKGLAISEDGKATLMAITFDKKVLNHKSRIGIVDEIKEKASLFEKKHNVKLHYSGMPYIRTEFSRKVAREMYLFLALAITVTAIILILFFRSFRVVLYSMIIVAIGIIWSLGSIHLFGFQITILTSLIPPLIAVIAVPNVIFLVNKYQSEMNIHGNKMKALTRTISKVGLSNFLANITTAIGFFVFYFTKSQMLMEFGLVASVNVMATYSAALIFIPIVFSYLPPPKQRHIKHLSSKWIHIFLEFVNYVVYKRRKILYLSLLIITIISVWGMTKIKVIGYVVDDLPKDDPIYTDLRFFESKFNGVLPFEISIDTKKEKGIFSDDAQTLYKIKALQKIVSSYKEFSKPLSIVEGLRFAYQAYKGGDIKYYNLPGISELKKLSEYIETIKGQENKFTSFLDSTYRYTRVSYYMADVGSVRIKEIADTLKMKIDSIFNPNQYKVNLTGHSLVFLKGNDYLFYHLFISLIIAIILILLIGLVLFRSISIIVLSKIPCLIPLIITAGIMGFFDIHFKPSTILIFSIAFGIASDGTIYILTEYKNQLRRKTRGEDPLAIANTVKEVGFSMVYTATILFCGFAIFTASGFSSISALGLMISLTLLMSMCANLILLPAILLSLEKRINKKDFLKNAVIPALNDNNDDDENNQINQ